MEEKRNELPRNYHPYMTKEVRPTYKYYDTPDGEDLLPKLIYIWKGSLKAGFFAGALGSFMVYKNGDHYLKLYGNIVKFGVPWIFAGTAFTIGTYMSTKIRKQDDELNHLVGATLAGLLFGTYFKSFAATVCSSLGFSSAAYFKKYCALNNIEFPVTGIPRETYSSWYLRNIHSRQENLANRRA